MADLTDANLISRRRMLIRAGFGGAGLLLALATASGVSAGGNKKCNAGRGNLSETDPNNDCDPGNSGANNQGGD